MKKLILFAAASAVPMSACAGASAPRPLISAAPGELVAARFLQEPAPSPLVRAAAEHKFVEVAPLSRRSRSARRDAGAPASRVEAANRAAVREPSGQGYVNAAQIYPWSEGALYRLYTAPQRVSEIALQPGEMLISVAAGDTVRWVIGDTTSGSGAARRTHILVKPSAVGLRTNLVISTDRRVYHVQLESTARTSMASISWTYPQDALLALARSQSASEAAEPVADELSVEALNFGYVIEGDKPPWRPVRAFDDGRQVFIQFPPGLGKGEAPPLFVTGEGGRTELVNYRLRGRYYVVDRLFSAAELRLGERRRQVVRIIRADAAKVRSRGRKAS